MRTRAIAIALVVVGVLATLAGLYGQIFLTEDDGHHDGRAFTFALEPVSGADELRVEEVGPGELAVSIERAGVPLAGFDDIHGGDLHVFVVATDLGYFDHVTQVGDDVGAPVEVPAGEYRVVVQAAPAGGPDLLELGAIVEVDGGDPAPTPDLDAEVWTDGDVTVRRQGLDFVLDRPWNGDDLPDGPAFLTLFGGPDLGFVHDHAELVGDDRFSFAVDLPGLGDYLAAVEFEQDGERRTALFRFTL